MIYDRVYVNDVSGGMWEEAVVPYFKVLSPNLSYKS
jgi:hypothetical protein